MTTSLRVCLLSLSFGSLLALGCGSRPQSGLRSCFDTGSDVVCVQSAALSTADRDVNDDGVPDKFVCADDDDDGHDRDRDRDRNPAVTAPGTADEDHDGVADDLDCGHRAECHDLENPENMTGAGGSTAITKVPPGPTDDHGGGDHGATGGAGGDDRGDHGGTGGAGGAGGDSHGDHGGAGGDGPGDGDHAGAGGDDHGDGDHAGAGGDGGAGGHDGDDHSGRDEHPRTGCNPPVTT
jgi:hypothetical protein